jgi:hypothetical protein
MARAKEVDGFVAPTLAPVLFWFYAVVVGIGAGLAIAAGQWIVAMLYLGAIVVVRLFVEAVLMLFRIHDVLAEIRDQPAAAAAAERLATLRARAASTTGELRIDAGTKAPAGGA